MADEEVMEEGTPNQRGVFILLTTDENGEDRLSFQGLNMDPLAISTLVLMAANTVKRNLGL